ncbi:Diguanylate cyclase/phosphodiesterase domain 2 (EAL) [Klebsiella pneumoniae IS46]|nr:Diguanylate cyclase/phosphodiesterase domain 2 (EAL) [Klebsiella pneumoniae IS46]
MLTTLIYRSQVHPDRPPVDLDALVHRASSKNLPLGITGILLFNGLQFSRSWKGLRRHLSRCSAKSKATRVIAT